MSCEREQCKTPWQLNAKDHKCFSPAECCSENCSRMEQQKTRNLLKTMPSYARWAARWDIQRNARYRESDGDPCRCKKCPEPLGSQVHDFPAPFLQVYGQHNSHEEGATQRHETQDRALCCVPKVVCIAILKVVAPQLERFHGVSQAFGVQGKNHHCDKSSTKASVRNNVLDQRAVLKHWSFTKV